MDGRMMPWLVVHLFHDLFLYLSLVEVGLQRTEFLAGQFRTLVQLWISERLRSVMGVSHGLNTVRIVATGMAVTPRTG
jgi:predicted membrane-bound spermidine synthase